MSRRATRAVGWWTSWRGDFDGAACCQKVEARTKHIRKVPHIEFWQARSIARGVQRRAARLPNGIQGLMSINKVVCPIICSRCAHFPRQLDAWNEATSTATMQPSGGHPLNPYVWRLLRNTVLWIYRYIPKCTDIPRYCLVRLKCYRYYRYLVLHVVSSTVYQYPCMVSHRGNQYVSIQPYSTQ